MRDRRTGRPLRITHVVTTDAFAGIERYVVEVANELAARGQAVDVVGGEQRRMQELLDDEVRWRPGGDTRTALRALCAGGRRDVVHSHLTKSDFCAAAAAPVTGGRRVSTRHLTVRRGYTPAAQRLARPVRRMMSCEIAVSAFVAGAVESPVDEVLVNGVAPVPDDGTARRAVVLVAQRLEADKDPATAIRAFALSGLAEQGWELQVAGSGELQPELTALAAELGIADRTQFLGWVDDIERLHRTAGILLAAAPRDPCPLTVLEAMAHGLPVVASSAGGHLETVGVAPSALLFPPGDAAGAGRVLRELAGDDAARRRYGAELRQVQRQDFTLERHVDRLSELYTRTTAGRRAGRRG